jgi:flagellar biosynthesis/type III secretory pathway protein FliH
VIKQYAVTVDEAKYAIPVTPAAPENIEIEADFNNTDDADDFNNINNIDNIENTEDARDTDITDIDIDTEPDGRDGETEEPKTPKKAKEDREAKETQRIAREREQERAARKAQADTDANAITAEARSRAGEIIAQAKQSAELIVSHTLENARLELNSAITQGYTEGFEAGRSEAAGMIAPALEKVGKLSGTVGQMQDEMLDAFKDEMFGMISEISKKIIHREINGNDEYLLTLFEDALKGIKAENQVTVTVSESQAEFAVRNIDLFRSRIAHINAEDFMIVSDRDAPAGTMIVETDKTVADASCEAQLGKIDGVLKQIRANLESLIDG